MSISQKKLILTISGERVGLYAIEFWSDYGVVAPNWITTNGSFDYAARMISDYVRDRGYKVVDSQLPGTTNYKNSLSLKLALKRAYDTWMLTL
jgi:hypothetical protein